MYSSQFLGWMLKVFTCRPFWTLMLMLDSQPLLRCLGTGCPR